MSPPIHIHPATADDHDWIVDAQLRMADETEALALDRSIVADGVRAVLDDPHKGAYWVARVENSPAGVLLVTLEWSDWRNAMFWWIQSVYVAPQHRGRGVFTAMYSELQRIVRADEGLCGLRLYVERDNQRAKSTYHRLGMGDCGYDMMQWKKKG